MIDESILKTGERAVFALRQLYRSHGYLPYKMSKFEELEYYIRNKDFLISDRFITFNDLGGKLRKQENQARILYEYAAGLYDELSDSVKLDILRDVIYADLSDQISEEAIRKFDRKGWEL